mmetsp:Transcript_16955/g.25575  ORF Transcript_16955/g.25575 Transcript_16955/m.25575 type:complete len:241 (-) Transcript_16955:266-988(-)
MDGIGECEVSDVSTTPSSEDAVCASTSVSTTAGDAVTVSQDTVKGPFISAYIEWTQLYKCNVGTRIPWRRTTCGGSDIFGSPNCTDTTCHCSKRINHNYHLWFALAQVCTYSNAKPHRFQPGENGVGEAFESLVEPFFSHSFVEGKGYRKVDGSQLQTQFKALIKDFENRHALSSSSAGFECHPVDTPFDKLVQDLYKERREARLEKEAHKQKEARKEKACLHFESTVLIKSSFLIRNLL